MHNFLDKEYHPVIEDFIASYVDDNMGSVERESFEEVLVHDDGLRELAFSANEGKKLLDQFQSIKAKEGFIKRLKDSLTS
jgi:hypothetical protein